VFRPRLIYYSDAHHFHAKRLEPPLSRHKLNWPVDELVGTGVDLLVFGLGYGDAYFHDTKIGRIVGDEKEVWDTLIDWRIMRMVEEARRLGTDQLRAVVERGRELGLKVFPSLKLQDGAEPEAERCGWVKWKHGREVCLNEKDDRHPGFEFAYDFANNLVRQDKLAILREALEDYGVDGIELDFMFFPAYFRKSEVESNIPLMNDFVSQVRALTREVGQKQGRDIPVCARVHHRRDENLKIGLDVESWLNRKHVDLVVAQTSDTLFDTGIDVRWLSDAANSAGAAAYLRPALRVYDERSGWPVIENYRALGQTLLEQGMAGMYLGYLPWPFSETEYQILREVSHPDAHGRSSKRYLLQPREGQGTFTAPPERHLPAPLRAGKTIRLPIRVNDDLDGAREEGEMRSPQLTIRFADLCIEDRFSIRFNETDLPVADAEVTDERATRIPVSLRTDVDAPLVFAGHWFRYSLDVDLLRRGENVLEIDVTHLDSRASWERSVNGVEIRTRYKDFERPRGIEDVERVKPLSP
tara:strand:+ start:1698 stop:3275 length:1578 start_codon:yes stop_codon:yes gene_type:complete